MDNSKIANLTNSAQLDRNMDIAANYTKICVLLEYIKSSCESLCSQVYKNENVENEDINTIKEKLVKLENIINSLLNKE
jgi:hypothetical protein